MSADYNFWKYKQDVVHEDEKVYASLCDGEQLEELQSLPIEKIRERIRAVFSGWDWLNQDNCEKEGFGSFTLYTTPQLVRFDCYGMSEQNLNLFIDVMTEEFGIPVYDPQISTRFDTWTDV